MPVSSAQRSGPVRAAVYRRMSEGKDTPDWEERQFEDGVALAERMGGTVAPEDVYTDVVSASKFSKKERKDYLRLLAAIEAPDGPRIVVAWMEDRAHRQVLELAEFIDVCREHGVRVATPAAEYDLDDPDAVSLWFIKVRFAEAEVEKTSKRLRRQRQQAAEKGYPQGGSPRHFGFQKWVKGQDGRMVPGNAVPMSRVRQEQELIREAVARIIAGDSVRGIVNDWNARGVRTTTDGAWSRFGFRRVMTSPALAGLRDHKGATYPAVWAPVVPREDWEQVRAILADPARKVTRGRGPAYLLTGLIYCWNCKQRMRARNHWHRDLKRPFYMCETFGPDTPPRLARLVGLVDEEVMERVFYRVESPHFQGAAGEFDEDPTRVIYADLARLQGLLDRLEDKVADELISPPTAKRKRAEFEAQMVRLRERLAALTGGRVRAHIPPNLREVWPDLSLDRRRAILLSLIERVWVLPVTKPGGGFDPDAIRVMWIA